MNNPRNYMIGATVLVLGAFVALIAAADRKAAPETPTAVDLATLIGNLETAREMGHDGIDRYMAQWGGKKLWVNAYLSGTGPWCYELATTPKDGEGAQVYAFAGNRIFRGDIPKQSFVVAECRIAITPIGGQPLLLADTDFVQIDRPAVKIIKSKE